MCLKYIQFYISFWIVSVLLFSSCHHLCESCDKVKMTKRSVGRNLNFFNNQKPFVCHREGYFGEKYGNGYHKCSRNNDGTLSAIRLRCADGERFDQVIRRCTTVRNNNKMFNRYHHPWSYLSHRRSLKRRKRLFKSGAEKRGNKKNKQIASKGNAQNGIKKYIPERTVDTFKISNENNVNNKRREYHLQKRNDNNEMIGNDGQWHDYQLNNRRKKDKFTMSNRKKDVSFLLDDDLLIEVPLDSSTNVPQNERNVLRNEQIREDGSTLSPDIVINLKKIDDKLSETNDLSVEDFIDNRQVFSRNLMPGMIESSSNSPFHSTTASSEEVLLDDHKRHKLFLVVGRKSRRLGSGKKKTTVNPQVTCSNYSTTILTTPITTTTTTTTPVPTTSATPQISTSTITTTTCVSSTTTTKKIKNIFKALKDGSSPIKNRKNETNNTSADKKKTNNQLSGKKTSEFFICNSENPPNNSTCDSFYLCHSARSTGKVIKLKIPCPVDMGFDSKRSRCTKSMGRSCGLNKRKLQ